MRPDGPRNTARINSFQGFCFHRRNRNADGPWAAQEATPASCPRPLAMPRSLHPGLLLPEAGEATAQPLGPPSALSQEDLGSRLHSATR